MRRWLMLIAVIGFAACDYESPKWGSKPCDSDADCRQGYCKTIYDGGLSGPTFHGRSSR